MVNGGLYLVISNIAALLPFVYGVIIYEPIFTALIGTSGIVSMFYHLCQVGYFCLIKSNCPGTDDFSYTQFLDELIDFWAILYAVAYIIRITITYKSLEWVVVAIVVGTGIVFLPLVGDANFFIYEGVFLGAAAVAFVVIMWALGRWKWQVRSWKLALADMILAAAFIIPAFVLFRLAGDPDDSSYDTYHATWHLLIYLSVIPIMDVPYGNLFIYFANLFPGDKKYEFLSRWIWKQWPKVSNPFTFTSKHAEPKIESRHAAGRSAQSSDRRH